MTYGIDEKKKYRKRRRKNVFFFYTYIFMLKPCQYFNFSQRSLTVCLVLKWWYFFDGNFCFCDSIISRSENENEEKYESGEKIQKFLYTQQCFIFLLRTIQLETEMKLLCIYVHPMILQTSNININMNHKISCYVLIQTKYNNHIIKVFTKSHNEYNISKHKYT